MTLVEDMIRYIC